MMTHRLSCESWMTAWLWVVGCLLVTPVLGQRASSFQHPLPDVATPSPSTEAPLAYALPSEMQLPIPLYFEADVPAAEPRRLVDTVADRARLGEGTVQQAGYTEELAGSFPQRISKSARAPRKSSRQSLSTVVGALAMVLGLFLGFVWVSRKSGRLGRGRLPSDVVQTLGRFPLGHRQELHVVRFGSKVLALAVSATKIEPLGELSHPEEVARITRACLSGEPAAPENIQDMLARLAAESGEYLAEDHVRQAG